MTPNAPEGVREDSALIFAAQRGHLEVVEGLIRAGAPVNGVGRSGRTALMEACEGGHGMVAQLLVWNGADPGAADERGWRALTISAREGHEMMVEILTATDERFLNDALMVAVEAGEERFVDALCSTGMRLDHQDGAGRTAALLAAQLGEAEVLEVLIRHGATLTVRDGNGLGLAELARGSGDWATIELVKRELPSGAEEEGMGRRADAGEGRTTGMPVVNGLEYPTSGLSGGVFEAKPEVGQRETAPDGVAGESADGWEGVYGPGGDESGEAGRVPAPPALHPAKGLPEGQRFEGRPVIPSGLPPLQGKRLVLAPGLPLSEFRRLFCFEVSDSFAAVKVFGVEGRYEAREGDCFQVMETDGSPRTYRVLEISRQRMVLVDVVSADLLFATLPLAAME